MLRCRLASVGVRQLAPRAAASAMRACLPCAAAPLALPAPQAVVSFRFATVDTHEGATANKGNVSGDYAKRQGAYLLDKADVLARVMEVVKNFEKVDATKVTPESHFINDLGLDSLDVVEVVMALEQEFILDIPDHEAEKIQSIPEAVEYLSSNPMAK